MVLLGLALTALSACVPSRKYEEVNERYRMVQADQAATLAKLTETQRVMAELEAKLSDVGKSNKDLVGDTTIKGSTLRQLTNRYDKLNALNNELLDKYNTLLAGDRSENRKLLSSLEEMRLQMQVREDSLNALAQRVEKDQLELRTSKQDLASLRAELEQQRAAMQGLRERVSKALTGFEGKGLTVEQHDGKIYVKLDNKLLFPSGSTTVDGKGREALANLAKVLESEKDLSIVVEGHTDTDKVLAGAAYKDNWDLSVLRATSVVRILQESARIEPERINASGKGEYVPVDVADKSRNRRIEIVLSPDLDELYRLVRD
jgi:chemotaxis protein MotB